MELCRVADLFGKPVAGSEGLFVEGDIVLYNWWIQLKDRGMVQGIVVHCNTVLGNAGAYNGPVVLDVPEDENWSFPL